MAARGIEPPQPPTPSIPSYHAALDCEFAGRTFNILPGVYEPGPTSMTSVAALTARLIEVPHPIIADVGTGSGAIGITFALARPDATVYALDISEAAAECAARNADALGAPNVHVLQGSLLEPLANEGVRLDAISAQLPWVPRSIVGVKNLLRPDHWRGPPQAIIGEDTDGLGLIRKLMQQAEPLLEPNGFMVLELAEWQCPIFAAEYAATHDAEISPGGYCVSLWRRDGAARPAP